MPPRLKTGREARAGLDRRDVTVSAEARPIRLPANPPGAVGRSIALPFLAAASLLIHAGIIGALVIDFRSWQAEAGKPRAAPIEVELVRDPTASLFRHPTRSGERALRSTAAADEAPVAPLLRSPEPAGNDQRQPGATDVEPRRSDEGRADPFAVSPGIQASNDAIAVEAVSGATPAEKVPAGAVRASLAAAERLAPVAPSEGRAASDPPSSLADGLPAASASVPSDHPAAITAALESRPIDGMKRLVPATPSRAHVVNEPSAPSVELPAVQASLPTDDRAVLVAAAEPRLTDDSRLPSVGGRVAIRVRDAEAGLAMAMRAVPTPTPAPMSRPKDAATRSLAGEPASMVADAAPAAAATDNAVAHLPKWDGAPAAPASEAPAAIPDRIEPATPTPVLSDRNGGDEARVNRGDAAVASAIAEEKATEARDASAVRVVDPAASARLAADSAASIASGDLARSQAAEGADPVRIRMVHPSMTAAAAPKVEGSEPAAVARPTAIATIDAAWSPWGVQVAGDFSLDRAVAAFQQMQRQFPEIRAARPLVVQKVDHSRGWAPFYQILIPAADQKAADAICRRLESAQGACVVFKN
jgi:hypothetical protein